MKNYNTYIFFSFLLLLNFQSIGQQTQSHQSQSPPANPGYTFTRGIFVDCADKIIFDISGRNILGLEQDLIDYLRYNYIGYVILRGIEHSNIFGSPPLEKALRLLMNDLRRAIPGIKIGISGSDEGVFQNTADITLPASFGNIGFPNGTISNVSDLNDALNNPGINSINQKRKELCKFFFRAAQFGYEIPGLEKIARQIFSFDALYVEYRYWNLSSNLQTMQNEFTNFKTILSVMQILKSKYTGIRSVDAEFLPSEIYTLQAWTAIDQITEADPLADVLMIPAFTGNATDPFNITCKTFHFLSDRFSKPNSKIFLELSAESSSFNFCNSTNSPQDFLGDYLNGITTPSGNLYSVEKMFIDKFNDPSYMCPACSCRPFTDDHYSLFNTSANTLAGVMWGPYTIMKYNNLLRTASIDSEDGTYENEYKRKDIVLSQLYDMNGRIVRSSGSIQVNKNILYNESLPDGIYLLKIILSDGKTEIKKVFMNSH